MKQDITLPPSTSVHQPNSIITLIIVCLILISATVAQAAVNLQWNTFSGSSFDDYGTSMVVDSNGNVYVAGSADGPWGSPINAYAGNTDAFVVKLDSNGVLQWITFMGSTSYDAGNDIALDDSGNVYITGVSYAGWGTPVNSFSGGPGTRDAFVAKLNSSGIMQWNTFMGANLGWDYGNAVTVDGGANAYVTGKSHLSWGTPLNSLAGGYDAFVAKFNGSGVRQWNTFMGASASDATGNDDAHGITVDNNSNIYIVGESGSSWGGPVNAHDGGGSRDVFVVKLYSSGSLQWNTFMGSAGTDYGYSIAVDDSGNSYAAGTSDSNWGAPVNTHAGWGDAFAAKLNSSGVRQWNTFMGSANSDEGYDIAVDSAKSVFLAGTSWATWGAPLTVTPHSGGSDAFAAKLSSSGVLQWNTFMGSSGADDGLAVYVDKHDLLFIAGSSNDTWGTPVNAYAGGEDAFIAGFEIYKFPWVLFNPAFIKGN